MKFFKTGLAISAFTVFVSLAISNGAPKETQVATVSHEGVIEIASEKIATSQNISELYNYHETFISPEQSAEFNFTTVGGTWEEIVPNGTNVHSYVRFKNKGTWSEWLELDAEEDFIQSNKVHDDAVRRAAVATSEPSSAFQYKFEMYGDGTNTPQIHNAEWTFIRTAEKEFAPEPESNIAANIALNTSSTKVIRRSQWGANEAYRYLANNDEEADLVDTDPEIIEKFADELKHVKVITHDADGDKYKWPLQYPEEVKKIIVHHTATTKNLNNPKQAIRDIYYFHAVSRGWGDVGYNYFVDHDGKVYEGRYGGEGVVGAHAGISNTGSIGIAVLGNFQADNVPEKAVASLAKLVGEKAQIHDINATGRSSFRGKNLPNVIGHSDVMHTSCPGIYLYEKLPYIRSTAAKVAKAPEKKKFTKDYDFIDQSDFSYLDLKPSETETIEIKLQNIGKKDWPKGSYLVMDKNDQARNLLNFPGNSSIVRAYMKDTTSSGKTATFELNLQSSQKSGAVDLKLTPVIDGYKMRESITVTASVQQTDYRYQLVDAKYPPAAMEPGQSFTAWVKLKNTGNTTWKRLSNNSVKLGADQPRDHINPFTGSTRVGVLEENEVKPGEVGKFLISLKAPNKPGFYREYFTPVVEGVTWMQDAGMYFETTVGGDDYSAEVEKVLSVSNWQQGKKYLVKISLRNTGTGEWNRRNLDLEFIKERDVGIEKAQLIQSVVKPGELGTISFVAAIDKEDDLGTKTLQVKPTVNGSKITRLPVRVRYTVTKGTTTTSRSSTNTVASSSSDPIRIKLGYEGTPEITANGTFQIYSDNDLVTTLSAGQKATVSYENGKYKIKTPKTTYSKSSPARFVPKNAAILQIANYDNSPAWNADLNDNQFRGNLEVRNVSGDLTVINELPLEDYLAGLGEVSNSEETEKIKAVMVAARTYAQYYMTVDEKFPGKPYHLSDDPYESQKYIGYGFEKRAPNVKKAVQATSGEVVTYNGKLVKTPYFNQSDGTKTKSAQEVWGWRTTPYLISVDDSFCAGTTFRGHGVGLSGCGSHTMAKQGYTYIQILKHYYTGVEVEKV